MLQRSKTNKIDHEMKWCGVVDHSMCINFVDARDARSLCAPNDQRSCCTEGAQKGQAQKMQRKCTTDHNLLCTNHLW